MDNHSNDQEPYIDTCKQRGYKCPCGKSYYSYPALFTHIKQKHDGKPPGSIQKPKSLNTKRGRPSLKSKQNLTQNQNYSASQKNPEEQQIQQIQQTPQEKQRRQKAIAKAIFDIGQILKNIPQENICKVQLNQIEAFAQMSVHIKIQIPKSFVYQNICIADGLVQFLKEVCQITTWKRFQQLYVFYMIFLQFIMDEENNKKIIVQAPMDLLCEHINDFFQNHLMDMAEYYGVQNMAILKGQFGLNIFHNFFIWMMEKRYTTYSVSMQNETLKSVDSTVSLAEVLQKCQKS